MQRVEAVLAPDQAEELKATTGEYTSAEDQKITYWPSPMRREPPRWLVEINDGIIRDLIKEVYDALNANLRSIAAMGVRAVLDRTFELAGADAEHGFAQKLASLESQGVISTSEKELLLIITDAGSAAAHRG